MNKTAATNGLYLGLYLGIAYLLQVLFPTVGILKTISSILQLLSVFLAYHFVKTYRDRQLGGHISFGQAWVFGLWLYVFSSLITAVFHYAHMEWIQPDFLSDIYNQMLLAFEQASMPAETIDMMARNDVPSAATVTFSCIWLSIIGGGILSVFYALIAKKEADFGGDIPAGSGYGDSNTDSSAQ